MVVDTAGHDALVGSQPPTSTLRSLQNQDAATIPGQGESSCQSVRPCPNGDCVPGFAHARSLSSLTQSCLVPVQLGLARPIPPSRRKLPPVELPRIPAIR
jgi:hypothetical protein